MIIAVVVVVVEVVVVVVVVVIVVVVVVVYYACVHLRLINVFKQKFSGMFHPRQTGCDGHM